MKIPFGRFVWKKHFSLIVIIFERLNKHTQKQMKDLKTLTLWKALAIVFFIALQYFVLNEFNDVTECECFLTRATC